MAQNQDEKKRRRRVLAAAAALAASAAGVLAFSWLWPRPKPKPRETPTQTVTTLEADVIAVKVDEAPIRDPDSPLWEQAEESSIRLAEQAIVPPIKMDVPGKPLKVRVLYDSKWVAFRLEWEDESVEQHTIKVRQFRDSCAVLLTKHPAPPEARFMGTKDTPATILHWRADWQLDVEEGFQDLEVAFPNVASDYYPMMMGKSRDGKPPKTTEFTEEARLWIPGWSVGNPISQPEKKSPVEKLLAVGPGSITSLPTQDAEGWGRWVEGKWRVVIAKKLKASDEAEGEISLEPGQLYTVAFTVWYGQMGDRGARKNPSFLHTLKLE